MLFDIIDFFALMLIAFAWFGVIVFAFSIAGEKTNG